MAERQIDTAGLNLRRGIELQGIIEPDQVRRFAQFAIASLVEPDLGRELDLSVTGYLVGFPKDKPQRFTRELSRTPTEARLWFTDSAADFGEINVNTHYVMDEGVKRFELSLVAARAVLVDARPYKKYADIIENIVPSPLASIWRIPGPSYGVSLSYEHNKYL